MDAVKSWRGVSVFIRRAVAENTINLMAVSAPY